MIEQINKQGKYLNIVDRNKCTGCGACSVECSTCIVMENDQEGFVYPYMRNEANCINCGKCSDVCPVHNTKFKKGNNSYYAMKSKNNFERLNSSSGGVFPLLAKEIIRKGGSVFGARYDEDFRVCFSCANKCSELSDLQGTKYSQGDAYLCFNEIKKKLDDNEHVMFSGLPCQVAGLKAFLRKEYTKLICIDLVCHSVPSPKAWEKYLEFRMRESNSRITNINMRDKGTGWSNYNYSTRFCFKNGSESLIHQNEDKYMKLFVSGLFSRRSCCDCHFKGLNRHSDITIGDFWGIWDINSKMDDNKGVSLVITHSGKGETLINKIADSVDYESVEAEDAVKENPAIMQSIEIDEAKNEIFHQMIINNNFEEIFQEYELFKNKDKKSNLSMRLKSKLCDYFIKNNI